MAYDFSTIRDPLVQQYLADKYGKGDKVKSAQEGVDTASMLGVATGAADSIANAMNQPVVLQNRMQDLGKAPAVLEGRQQRTDVSGLQKQAQMKLQQAQSDEDNAVKMAFEQRKAELAAEAAASRQAVEDERWNKSFAGQEAARAEAARHNKAMEGKTRPTDPLRELLLAEQLKKITNENNQAPKMPIEDQKVVEALATKNAGKISIANQIDSYLSEFKNAPDEATKLRIGGQMLKVLNSPEGADAIGVEEAKRLGDALEFQVFNVLGAGPMFGRDLDGFQKQVEGTSEAIKGGVKTNQGEISRITGRGQKQAAPAAGPKAGDVMDGYVFMGGNPSDPASWKKQ